MKDLDFDELDRAVNSLIGGSSVHATDPEVEQPIDITAAVEHATSQPVPSLASESSTAVQPLTPPATPLAPVSQQSPPLAARRSSGRFMDVVHPSSDMRAPSPVLSFQPRVGVSIAPPSVPTADVARPVIASPDPVAATPPPEQNWPDPIDFHGYNNPEPAVEALVINPDPVAPIVADAATEASLPLESPFLSDAKVEKRPLGAFSDDGAQVSAELPVTQPDTIAPEPVPQTPIVPAVEPVAATEPSLVADSQPGVDAGVLLPAELQNDLLTVEADEDTSHQQQPTVEETTVPVIASITQQYTEQPSTGDQPTGAIFDTQAYKKPLAHPKKKKSGWLMVLWIFVLLVIGAGVGAAVYFYVLPQL